MTDNSPGSINYIASYQENYKDGGYGGAYPVTTILDLIEAVYSGHRVVIGQQLSQLNGNIESLKIENWRTE